MVRADMPLIADGAMGTELLARSGFKGLPARLNLLQPELVLALHREYVAAGARFLVANTLGGTPDDVAAGVALAREAADAFPRACSPAHPLASFLGPTSETIVAASVAPGATEQTFQAAAGADVIILETLTTAERLESVRELTSLPLIATFSFLQDRTLAGLTPAEVAARVQPLGLAAFGYGCGFGPDAARQAMAELRDTAPGAVLIAKPNLGPPPYTITPDQLAGWATDMASLGVQVIGACCGSTPAHIRALGRIMAE